MLRLCEMFEEHMVLQRGRPVPVWGVCDGEGARVRVTVAGRAADAVVENGRFRATLPALPAGGPYALRVDAAGESVELSDVLVGEVWLAGGQSNMEMPLFAAKGARKYLDETAFGRLRLKTVSRRSAGVGTEYGFHFIPESSDETAWQAADAHTAALFSAIGCVVGDALEKQLRVPVGIISCNYGGTKVQPWVSPEALETEPVFAGDAAAHAALRAGLGEKAEAAWLAFQKGLEGLLPTREDFVRRSLEDPLYYWRADGEVPWPPDGAIGDPNEPCCLYRHMLSRVVPFAMRGVVWYQGESSAAFQDCAKYGRQMRVLIRDWRRAFENDGLAFVQTQLAGYDTSRRADPCDWPAIREAQRRLCHTETNVFIANMTGLGELRNIHPVYKIEAGRRLADAALRHVYAQDCPVAPEAEWAAREGEWLRVAFCHGEDLRAAGEVTQLETGDGETWTPAKEFRVEGGTLAVRTGANRVRYGWRCDPEGSLQNAAGLPVTPFEIAVKENTPYELD